MKTIANSITLASLLVILATARSAGAPPSPVKLPGMLINLEHRYVDLEATVCLDQGCLELIACTKGSKEHESIVAVTARPMHIHTALLLLGATNGNPAMRKPANEQETRWVDVPPRGDLVDVYLVFKNSGGDLVEDPISDFVKRSDNGSDDSSAESTDDRTGPNYEEDTFPRSFIFAGSHVVEEEGGQRKYLADVSGNVISIATFGDEVLCLPGRHTQANDALMWQVDAAKLPKVGSKVTLRLRPHAKKNSKVKNIEQQHTTSSLKTK